MLDISDTIEAKSDQLNAIELITGPKTIEVSGVKKVKSDQPIVINYVDDKGKPYKPCLGMRRVLIELWGKDASKWNGRKMVLFNEPTVKWAGKEQGGIEISHVSGIDEDRKCTVTLAKGKFKIVTIKPLVTAPLNPLADESLAAIEDILSKAESMADLQAIKKRIDAGKYDADGTAKTDAAYKEALTRVREAAEAIAE